MRRRAGNMNFQFYPDSEWYTTLVENTKNCLILYRLYTELVISFRLTEKIKVENISSSMTSCLVWMSRNRKQSGAENGRPTQEVIDLKIHSYFRKQRTSKNIQNAFGFNFHNSFSLKTLKIHFSKGWGERIKVKFKSWASGYFSTGLTGTHEAATWTEEDL